VKTAQVAALGVLLAGLVAAPNLTGGGPQVYNSGNTSERVTSLPVYKTGNVAKATVYCIDLGDPPAGGEVLQASGEFEATNYEEYETLVQSQLLLTSSCTATSGVEITEGAGYNFDLAVHHGTSAKTGALEVPAGNSRRFVVMVAWAMTGWGNWQSGDTLRVEQDYGRLSVLRWR
jgi:hypothetical protein